MANDVFTTLSKKSPGGTVFNGMAEMFGLSDNFTTVMLPIDTLIENANHPFKVRDDKQFEALAESIRSEGMIQPIIVRRLNEKYEILSGHRRTKAALHIGQNKIKAIVIEADDELADRILIVTNFLQREVILPSEIAKSYLLRYNDLKKSLKSENSDGRNFKIDKILENEFSTSKSNIYMYLRFNKLIEAFLDMVDNRKLKLKVAAELSYLRETEQTAVYSLVFEQKAVTIDYKQAAELKRQSGDKELSADEIKLILTKPVTMKVTTNIFNNSDFKKYIRKFDSIEVMKKTVLDFLEAYKGEVEK